MGLQKQLRDIETNLAILSGFPTLKHLPVVLGESDPEGCAACSARVHPQNGYRNGPLYGVYVVESMLRTYELSARAGIEVEGAVTWAFLFEDQPWFDGFRDLATNGVDKAVLNAFRMLGKLGGNWVEATSDHGQPLDAILAAGVRETPDINAVATRDGDKLSVLAWNYHDDDVVDGAAEVTLDLDGLPSGPLRLTHYRMDHDHSNAYAAWKAMGAPQEVPPEARDKLEAASRLAVLESRTVEPASGAARLAFTLPRQGVSLLRLEP
jgi:xylan 1,4-beta-xylosidase